MNKHPFFMKEPPKPGQELHPLLEGLQALKYDPEENEPEGRVIIRISKFVMKYVKNFRIGKFI